MWLPQGWLQSVLGCRYLGFALIMVCMSFVIRLQILHFMSLSSVHGKRRRHLLRYISLVSFFWRVVPQICCLFTGLVVCLGCGLVCSASAFGFSSGFRYLNLILSYLFFSSLGSSHWGRRASLLSLGAVRATYAQSSRWYPCSGGGNRGEERGSISCATLGFSCSLQLAMVLDLSYSCVCVCFLDYVYFSGVVLPFGAR